MLLLKMSHGQKYSLWPKAFLWMPEVNLLTFIFCLGFKSVLQNGTKSAPRGPGSCSRCKCEQDSWVGPIPFNVLFFKLCRWYSDTDWWSFVYFFGKNKSLLFSAALTFPRTTFLLLPKRMFYYLEPLNYWQRENLTYVSGRGGLGGGQAQHTQSISQKEQTLMSGNLSKFHLRLKQSVGNQSSRSEPLPLSSVCSRGWRNFCFNPL